MKGQRNQSTVAAYYENPCWIDWHQLMGGSPLKCLTFRLPTTLVVFLLPQILVAEIVLSQSPAPIPATNSSRDGAAQSAGRSTLKVGSQGAEVTEVQAMLQLLGFLKDTVNGVYGQSTAEAVAKFQQVAGLTPDGIVGMATWNRLLPPTPAFTPTPAATGSAPEGFPLPTATPTMPSPTPSPTQSAPATHDSDRPATSQTSARPTPAALPILRMGMQGTAVTGLQERLRALGWLKSSADGVFGAETLAAVKAAQRQFSLEADGVVGPATWEALLR
ncbi:peptidoglycan-binding domain-containing protein [Pantanalinema rosaneae CENA516]|uniref:peptidoglycan-binding domain-containing protein n=1 Tax=Pantanalinema rosaneae TaxID=1620701 RepID=UPI003D6EF65E